MLCFVSVMTYSSRALAERCDDFVWQVDTREGPDGLVQKAFEKTPPRANGEGLLWGRRRIITQGDVRSRDPRPRAFAFLLPSTQYGLSKRQCHCSAILVAIQ